MARVSICQAILWWFETALSRRYRSAFISCTSPTLNMYISFSPCTQLCLAMTLEISTFRSLPILHRNLHSLNPFNRTYLRTPKRTTIFSFEKAPQLLSKPKKGQIYLASYGEPIIFLIPWFMSTNCSFINNFTDILLMLLHKKLHWHYCFQRTAWSG